MRGKILVHENTEQEEIRTQEKGTDKEARGYQRMTSTSVGLELTSKKNSVHNVT